MATVVAVSALALTRASPAARGDEEQRGSGVSADDLRKAYDDLSELVREKRCAPILLRLAWHEAGTFDKRYGNGGAIGTIRFPEELEHPNDAGLDGAVALIRPIHERNGKVSWADLIQMAGAVAVEVSGGPAIPMKYGRVDAPEGKAAIPPPNRLPDGKAPFHVSKGPCPWRVSKSPSPSAHLRRVFHRMGLTDQEMVALSGAHTLGRAYKSRSGIPSMNETVYTRDGPGTKGGMSWTKDWLKFDNSYFVELKRAKEVGEAEADPELLRMVTDSVLFEDPKFLPHALAYAADQRVFFEDYALAHAKLSELGATFVPPEGIRINKEPTSSF